MNDTITSVKNNLIQEVKRLRLGKSILFPNHFIVEGIHTLGIAFEKKALVQVIATSPLSKPLPVPTTLVSAEVMDSIALQKTPQGFLGICGIPPKATALGSKVLYLNDVSDPGNVGTLLRSAVSFGVDTVVTSPRTADLLHPKVLASSQGAFFYLAWMKSDALNLADIKKTHTVLAADLGDKSVPIESAKLSERWMLVLGNEAHGIEPSLKAMTHIAVKVPMVQFESLNVAIAGSILLYELQKKSR